MSDPTSLPPPVLGGQDDPIDYAVRGEDLQYVDITLDPGESVVAEAGALFYMEDGVAMQTVFGDGSQQHTGFLGSLIGAGQRLLTGTSLFMTIFQNQYSGRRIVAFAAPYAGKIQPVRLADIGGELIVQKDSFLCAAKGVAISIAFQRRIGAGLFGGEGFIMQRLQGHGWAFVHAGGTLYQRDLAPGEQLRVDTGCIVSFQPSVSYDIQMIGGVRNALFGGEGLFLATLTGPGRVWLQSLPFSRLADRIIAAAPQYGGKSVGEGSLLGGLGRLIDGNQG